MTFKWFKVYLFIIVLTRIPWMLGWTTNNRTGWITTQIFLTAGQFLFLWENIQQWIYLRIAFWLSVGFIGLLWIWNGQQSWYQILIQCKGYQLLAFTCFFGLVLVFSKVTLFDVGNVLYFAGLAAAAFFGNNGLLYNRFKFSRPSLDLFFSLWMVGCNLLWLIYFRGLEKRKYGRSLKSNYRKARSIAY